MGWIPDGLEDGMLSGRTFCPVCRGSKSITGEQLRQKLNEIIAAATPLSPWHRCGQPIGLSGYIRLTCSLPEHHEGPHRAF
ncbi:MAG: hypothetical protein IT406_03430 [Candidatus Yanofskybacteria bacterium]|nr:hypothetical protein [Candidatus Yanofskybacteria bacterium]